MGPRNNEGFLAAIAGGVGSVIDAILDDGVIAAAGRQGIGELGQALKAFPDSIQVEEPGTLFNPTQGEIAAARRTESILPGDIANDTADYMPEQDYDLGQDMSQGR
jgi:hypothetical protein